MYHTGTGVRKNLITKAKLIAVGMTDMTEAQADPHHSAPAIGHLFRLCRLCRLCNFKISRFIDRP